MGRIGVYYPTPYEGGTRPLPLPPYPIPPTSMADSVGARGGVLTSARYGTRGLADGDRMTILHDKAAQRAFQRLQRRNQAIRNK